MSKKRHNMAQYSLQGLGSWQMIWSITIAIRNCFRNIVVVRRISVNLLHYLSVLALYNCVYYLDNILFYWYSTLQWWIKRTLYVRILSMLLWQIWNFLSSLSMINFMSRFSFVCLFVRLFVCFVRHDREYFALMATQSLKVKVYKM